MQIASGSIVTYAGTWRQPLTTSSDALVAAVVTDLAGAGLASRGTPKIGQSLVGGLIAEPFTVTLQLQVENQGYASEDDLISVIRSFVNAEAGAFPSSDSVPFVQGPDGSVNATGQPSPGPSPSGCIAGSANDLTGSFSLSCWFSNLTTQGLGALGYLAIIAIVGIGIAVWAGVRPRA